MSDRTVDTAVPDRVGDLPTEAVNFLRQCADELHWSDSEQTERRAQVLAEIDRSGTYVHRSDELAFGARLAWRHHTRCIGQLYWRTLQVRDRRHVHTVDGVVDQLNQHLADAFDGGRIRPVITVFAPQGAPCPTPTLLSPQLVRYAGYRMPDGTVRGDPANQALTTQMIALGWAPRWGDFDRLPVLLRSVDSDLVWREVDERSCPDVPIAHPTHGRLVDTDLRWYAFPTVADMRLEIGGISYPTAPFSGWYVATEIGARNFGDTDRYDLLPKVAARLRIDTSNDRTLWKDRAQIELTAAVLASYEAAGIRILDHHTMTAQFHRYVEARRRAGASVHAEWAWIVPPIGASATPVYFQTYDPTVVRPNFFR
ncbi:nitric oxide synthase oxygenase [Micromonospora sp. NPDC047793]|uniref:nitric oxide synthase oxygenase n=1 Tax=Micromonospora sp. NPDC047793 TaxID=3154342 RepID=UPI0033EB8C27